MKYRAAAAWKTAPFVRLLVPFILGMVTFRYGSFPILLYVSLLMIAITLLGIIPFIRNHHLFQHYWLTGAALHLLLYSAGALHSWGQQPQHHAHWIKHHYQPNNGLMVTLIEPVIEKEKTWKAVASIDAIQKKDWKKVTGKIILYFKKDGDIINLKYGTRIFFNQPLQPIVNTGNPGAFDYQQYCYDQSIFYQVFLSTEKVAIISQNEGNIIIKYIYTLQEWILNVLRNYIPGEKERGLALALLMGYKNELDQTLVQSYTNTGVVHIIAISGMHLGIIYGLLSFVTQPLLQMKWGRWLKPVLIILVLWIFTILAGATASVVRSALMFTCFAMGEVMGKKSFLLNSLGASAFLLLWYHPNGLWEVGFQLSYIAVLSILLFMKPLYDAIFFENKLLDAIWKLVSVTIAVQIFTFPLTLYYFHQFPLYFLWTNLLAIPLSSIILLGTIALCMCAGVTSIALFIGQFIQWAIKGMNAIVTHAEKLPFAIIENIPVSFFQLILIYMVIICLALYIKSMKKIFFLVSLCSGCCISILHGFLKWKMFRQHNVVVFNIPASTAIALVTGNITTYIVDSTVTRNEKNDRYIFKPAKYFFHSETDNFHVIQQPGIIQLTQQYQHLFLANAVPELPPQCHLQTVILSGYHRMNPEQLFSNVRPSLVVADGSITKYQEKKLQVYCQNNQIPFHGVLKKGCFTMNLK